MIVSHDDLKLGDRVIMTRDLTLNDRTVTIPKDMIGVYCAEHPDNGNYHVRFGSYNVWVSPDMIAPIVVH